MVVLVRHLPHLRDVLEKEAIAKAQVEDSSVLAHAHLRPFEPSDSKPIPHSLGFESLKSTSELGMSSLVVRSPFSGIESTNFILARK